MLVGAVRVRVVPEGTDLAALLPMVPAFKPKRFAVSIVALNVERDYHVHELETDREFHATCIADIDEAIRVLKAS